jgi:hypothetical protein
MPCHQVVANTLKPDISCDPPSSLPRSCQTHAGATQGRQGLGRADAPKKVGGVRWQGKKTRLCSSDEEEEEEEGEQSGEEQEDDGGGEAGAADALAQAGIVIVAPKRGGVAAAPQAGKPAGGSGGSGKKEKKRRKEEGQPRAAAAAEKEQEAPAPPRKKAKKAAKQQQEEGAAAAAAVAAPGGSKVKWAAVAGKLLASAPKRRMRVIALHQQALAEAGLRGLAPGDADALMQQMLRKLRKAGPFSVCEKYVRLA